MIVIHTVIITTEVIKVMDYLSNKNLISRAQNMEYWSINKLAGRDLLPWTLAPNTVPKCHLIKQCLDKIARKCY